MDDHEAVNGRGDMHFLDVLLCLLHGEPCFVPFLFTDGKRRLVRGAVRLNVLLKLGQRALGFIQGKQVLLRINGAHQFVLGHFELRAAHRILCFQQRGLIFRRLDVGVCLGFYNLLLRLQQVAAILSEIVFLLAGIKFKHHVAGANLCPGTRQRDDLQRAPGDGRSDNRSRLGSSQYSGSEYLELKIDFFDGCGWNFGICRQDGRLAACAAGHRQREGQKKCSYF